VSDASATSHDRVRLQFPWRFPRTEPLCVNIENVVEVSGRATKQQADAAASAATLQAKIAEDVTRHL
jgi:hypothetical protein